MRVAEKRVNRACAPRTTLPALLLTGDQMKFVSCFLLLGGLSTLGACNAAGARPPELDARLANTPAPRVGPAKIVGYSKEPDAAKGYGESSGFGGGGGHAH
jgi:hypothetical protein